MLGPFLTACCTIDFLVDDCLGPSFITVGTWTIWSKKWVLTIWRKGKHGEKRPHEAGEDLAVSYEIIERGSDEGDHRDQPLDRVIVLAMLARQRWRAQLWSHNQHQFYTLLSPCSLWSLLVSVRVV